MEFFPPSLADDILQRCCRAQNGELGVPASDVDAFLTACEADRIEVLGWELWLVVDDAPSEHGEPQAAGGAIFGAIPSWALSTGGHPAIFGGSGDIRQTRAQIASLRLEKEIKPQWLSQVRFNFTLNT